MKGSLENEIHKSSKSIEKELLQGKDVVLKATSKGLKIQSHKIKDIKSEDECDKDEN